MHYSIGQLTSLFWRRPENSLDLPSFTGAPLVTIAESLGKPICSFAMLFTACKISLWGIMQRDQFQQLFVGIKLINGSHENEDLNNIDHICTFILCEQNIFAVIYGLSERHKFYTDQP